MSTPKFSKEELDWLYKNKIFSLKDFMQKVREAKILVVDKPPNCPNSSDTVSRIRTPRMSGTSDCNPKGLIPNGPNSRQSRMPGMPSADKIIIKKDLNDDNLNFYK